MHQRGGRLIFLMPSYFDKHLYCSFRIHEKPVADLRLVVVIPCFNEPDILATLNSLENCEPCRESVEVIIVINAPANAAVEIKSQNEKTFQEIIEWERNRKKNRFRLFVLRNEDLPAKHAGVGLARKIGMDEAAWRFESIRKKNGVIVCLDADCTVEANYLQAVETHFSNYPAAKAASIYFEHPLATTDASLREGIINYELHLRYYVHALRYAGYPYAFHTIGSAMCVCSDVYQRAGGMNRRKAGEDFYFLHKIIPLGGFGVINGTCVYPSPRISSRVPFGTGRAMGEWANTLTEVFLTYDLRIFEVLKNFIQVIPSFHQASDKDIEQLVFRHAGTLVPYLKEVNFLEKIQEIKENSAGAATFQQRFFRWMDGFRVLKMIHFLRDHQYPGISIQNAAADLLRKIDNCSFSEIDDLLQHYRMMDKADCFRL